MARRYRKKSHTSQIVRDTVYIGSRLPWWGALLFGLGSFSFFYFVAPAWVLSNFDEQAVTPLTEGIRTILLRRIHWLEYIGIVCGLICGYFAIRNYLISIQAQKVENTLIGILSRIIGRSID